MISFVRGSMLALMAMALCAPAQAGCIGLSGTADGFDKETAVSRAQLALADYVKQYKAEKKLRAVTVSAAPIRLRLRAHGAAASAKTSYASASTAAFTNQT